MKRFLLTSFILLGSLCAASAQDIKVAVTTSFHNSGLADVLLPQITTDTGLNVQLLVVGTGQALRLGQAGDVDAILVHAKSAEEAFVANGHGIKRVPIMYNDFVLVGPDSDPASLSQSQTVQDAFQRLATTQHPFVSRGDDSGTHKKELGLWAHADLAPDSFAGWYRAVGSGMGAALNTAIGMGAYILTDRASWLNFQNKTDFAILFEGDSNLFNQYSFIAIRPNGRDFIQHQSAQTLQDWLLSDVARDLINGYTLEGAQLFTYNAER